MIIGIRLKYFGICWNLDWMISVFIAAWNARSETPRFERNTALPSSTRGEFVLCGVQRVREQLSVFCLSSPKCPVANQPIVFVAATTAEGADIARFCPTLAFAAARHRIGVPKL